MEVDRSKLLHRFNKNIKKEKRENEMKKLLGVLALLLVLGACTNKTVSDNPIIQELLVKDQLIIGVSPDYEPMEFLDTSGKIVGFDIDMMEALIVIINEDNNLNLKLTWKSMDFDTIIGALQTKQIDIGVSGFTYDPQRDVFFSVPYMNSQEVAVVAVDSGITTVTELNGKKVGAQSGTTGEDAANDIPQAKVVSLTDAQQLFAQLQTKAIDAVIIDKPVADNFVKSNKGYVIINEALIDENTSIIIDKANVNLQKMIDAAISKFIKTAEYQALLKKWEIAQ